MKGCKHRLDWVVLLLLVACNRPHNTPVEMQDAAPPPIVVSPELLAIDSLMWTQPDSALALLCRDFACNVSKTEHDRHYANLLLAELRYKNDSAQANRTELRHAVAYFDSLVRQTPPLKGGQGDSKHALDQKGNLFFLSARAHYINGVGYYEHDSAVEACREYLTALETMENHFDEKDLVGKKAKFMVYIYNRLGDMFSKQFMMESAIQCYESALVYCIIEPTSPTGISKTLSRIGQQYDMKGEKDKAQYYYGQAFKEMPKSDNVNYRDLATVKALSDYRVGKGREQALEVLRPIIAQANSESEKLARFVAVGDIFYEEGMYDSALFYLEPVFYYSRNQLSQTQAAEFLQVIYDSIGDVGKREQCLRFLALYKKSEGETKALVSTLKDLFQDYSNRKQEKQAEIERGKAVKKTINIIIPIAVMVVLTVVCVLILRNKKQLKKQQEEANRRLGETMQEHKKELRQWQAEAEKVLEERDKRHAASIEAERQTHRMEQAAISGRLKRKNQEVRELKGQIRQQKELDKRIEHADMIQEERPNTRKTEYVALMNEDICISIVQRLKKAEAYSSFDVKDYASLALSDKEMEELVHAIDQHCPDFSKRMKRTYPGLGINDLQLCRLYLLDLSVLQVAILLGTDYSSIRKRTNRLKEKTGSEELCRNLKSTLFEE